MDKGIYFIITARCIEVQLRNPVMVACFGLCIMDLTKLNPLHFPFPMYTFLSVKSIYCR